jgi:hypothetical protein
MLKGGLLTSVRTPWVKGDMGKAVNKGRCPLIMTNHKRVNVAEQLWQIRPTLFALLS